jgi:hypothetical protein
MISWENYEEYMIMHADGELPPAGEQELMAFLDAHPQLKQELSFYVRTRLTPDETIIYTDKNSLLRQGPKRAVIFPAWVKYGVAAGIAAIMFVSSYKYWYAGNNTNTVVKNDTAKHTPAPTINVPVANTPVQNTQVPKQTITAITHAPVQHKQPGLINNKVVNKKQEAIVTVDNNVPAIQQPDRIKTLSVAGTKPLPCNNADVSLAQVDAPGISLPAHETEAKKTFWEWLPMEEEKKARIENMANVLAGAFSESDNKKEEPTDKKIDIKIEKRKLKLTF